MIQLHGTPAETYGEEQYNFTGKRVPGMKVKSTVPNINRFISQRPNINALIFRLSNKNTVGQFREK